MIKALPETYVAYRCPSCGSTVYGFVGKFALKANMLRLKCTCGNSAMDITITNDDKIRLSVPCLFCTQNHSYVLSQNIFFNKDIFLLGCPYSNMDICFIGEKEKTDKELLRTQGELEKLFRDLEVEGISDIQPTDMEEDEILPDAQLYDIVRFVVKDLEADGKIDCPCHSGCYELRFAEGGIEVYCPECNASELFTPPSVSAAEDYVKIDSITLKK